MIRLALPQQLFGKIIRNRGVQRACVLMAGAAIVTGTSAAADLGFLQGVNRLLELPLPAVASHRPESTVRIGPSTSEPTPEIQSSPGYATVSSNESRILVQPAAFNEGGSHQAAFSIDDLPTPPEPRQFDVVVDSEDDAPFTAGRRTSAFRRFVSLRSRRRTCRLG